MSDPVRTTSPALPRTLILLGVAVWIPYAIWKYLAGGNPPLLPFLLLHLCGVIPGAAMKILSRRRAARSRART